MKKTLLLLILASNTSFAQLPSPSPQPPLIAGLQISGYTRVEDHFEISCQLSRDGFLQGVKLQHPRGDGTWVETTAFQSQIKSDELGNLKLLITESIAGPLVETPAVCDAGTINVIAFPENLIYPIPIESKPDCSEGLHNASPAAGKILEWVKKNCGFKD
jgi:hypothetical protein